MRQLRRMHMSADSCGCILLLLHILYKSACMRFFLCLCVWQHDGVRHGEHELRRDLQLAAWRH